MQKIFITFLILFSSYFNSSIFYASAETNSTNIEIINARVLSSVWFSKLSISEGDNLKIYTAVQNNSVDDFTGTANFYVDDIDLASIDFVSNKNRLTEVSTSWLATPGSHQFYFIVKTSLPEEKVLISYQTEIVSLIINKKYILDMTSIQGRILNYISNIDSAMVPIIGEIDRWKKTIPYTPHVVSLAISDNNQTIKGFSVKNFIPEKVDTAMSISTAAIADLNDHKVDSLYNFAISSLSFLAKNWLLSLPLFLFLIWRIIRLFI